ncbi:MAG: hypothetical protein RLZ23_1305 [Actinomycetota bacterium]
MSSIWAQGSTWSKATPTIWRWIFSRKQKISLISAPQSANINLGASSPEFGQGLVKTVACDSQIFVKPVASFDNSLTASPPPTPSATGVFLLKSIVVSDIDSTNCDGIWFTFKAFNSSNSTPLEITSGLLSFSVLNTSGTYSTTQSGFSVTTNNSTSFTINFTTPILSSGSVAKVTLESSNSAPTQLAVSYSVGDTGPGGGQIFYVSNAGFNCGSSFTSTGSPTGGLCHYLEAAPVTWAGSSDPSKVWATAGYTTTDIAGITNDVTAYNNAAAIGLGYKNSTLIVGQGNTSSSAAGSARAYTGGGKSDWYLATTAELNLLCQWSRGMTQDVTALCTSGTDNANFFTNPAYWSSSEVAADQARVLYFNGSGAQDGRAKGDTNKVRPIRAF